MIRYLCRTYKSASPGGNFRVQDFDDRASAESCALEQSRRGFFSIIFSTGHVIDGNPMPDCYLCEYAADPRAELEVSPC